MIKLKSLLLELTQPQKELKKDYLFRQTKLQSSNIIPPFEKVWEDIVRSDGYKELYKDWEDYEITETEIMRKIKEEQFDRYTDIIDQYKQLNGERCWREITLPSGVNPIALN